MSRRFWRAARRSPKQLLSQARKERNGRASITPPSPLSRLARTVLGVHMKFDDVRVNDKVSQWNVRILEVRRRILDCSHIHRTSHCLCLSDVLVRPPLTAPGQRCNCNKSKSKSVVDLP